MEEVKKSVVSVIFLMVLFISSLYADQTYPVDSDWQRQRDQLAQKYKSAINRVGNFIEIHPDFMEIQSGKSLFGTIDKSSRGSILLRDDTILSVVINEVEGRYNLVITTSELDAAYNNQNQNRKYVLKFSELLDAEAFAQAILLKISQK